MPATDELLAKIMILNDTVWDRKAKTPQIDAWLRNFSSPGNGTEDERRLHALYLLSQFTYFGSRQMRELMRVLFRDLYKYPIVQGIRQTNGNTTDLAFINREFNVALDNTVFLGVGNPSESGCHLLYYFRQENGLPKGCFIHSHEIFERRRPTKWQMLASLLFNWRDRFAGTLQLRNRQVNRYVFIDDFCGSGHQAEAYSGIVEDIKSVNPAVEISYFVLCATSTGMHAVRARTAFDVVECVFELDDTFRCFSSDSRYFPSPWPTDVTAAFAEHMCRHYGATLEPSGEVGYGNCQLLLGFQHNTPDNTLPIFWSNATGGLQWTPIFKRYPKLYG